jgi:hypothetical protein
MKSLAGVAVTASLPAMLAAQAPPQPPDTFKPLVRNGAPVRSCESLLSVSVRNTTIDSASADETDPANPSCRLVATVTHPPAGDKVRIFLAFPMKNWTRLHPEQLWGSLVMLEAKNFLPMCKFNAAAAAATAACDEIDGVKDGVIEDPARCAYDPRALIGRSRGDCGTFAGADADVIRKIWEGPKRQDGTFLRYGLTSGADFGGLSGTQGDPPQGRPNPITLEWFRFFLTQNPQWDCNKGNGSTDEAASFECSAGF